MKIGLAERSVECRRQEDARAKEARNDRTVQGGRRAQPKAARPGSQKRRRLRAHRDRMRTAQEIVEMSGAESELDEAEQGSSGPEEEQERAQAGGCVPKGVSRVVGGGGSVRGQEGDQGQEHGEY